MVSKTARTDGIQTLDECRVIAAPLIEDIKRRPGAAARAKLEATAEGRALLAAAKAHLLEYFGLTPTPCAMQSRPCRCGPDGCADSGCPGRLP